MIENRFGRLAGPLAAVGLLLAPVPVLAQAADAVPRAETQVQRSGQADDQVVLVLEVEDWVETSTATVRIAADLAVETGGFGAARSDLIAVLDGFGTGATWRIVDFGKLRDDAGYERWRVVAEARVPEPALADLAGKAKAATRPGLALTVAAIDYTPTMAEREAVTDALRARIYARVAQEIAALDAVFKDRSFRVGEINFSQGFRPVPHMARAESAMVASAAKADAGGHGGGLAGAEKATLSARVVLAAAASIE